MAGVASSSVPGIGFASIALRIVSFGGCGVSDMVWLPSLRGVLVRSHRRREVLLARFARLGLNQDCFGNAAQTKL